MKLVGGDTAKRYALRLVMLRSARRQRPQQAAGSFRSRLVKQAAAFHHLCRGGGLRGSLPAAALGAKLKPCRPVNGIFDHPRQGTTQPGSILLPASAMMSAGGRTISPARVWCPARRASAVQRFSKRLFFPARRRAGLPLPQKTLPPKAQAGETFVRMRGETTAGRNALACPQQTRIPFHPAHRLLRAPGRTIPQEMQRAG